MNFILHFHISDNYFRTQNDGYKSAYDLSASAMRYQKKISFPQSSYGNFKHSRTVEDGVVENAHVWTKMLICTSSDGKSHFNFLEQK